MKILRKTIALIIIILMTITLTCNNKVNTFASSSLNASNNRMINIGVLIYSYNSPYLMEFKQGLENIEKEHKDNVRFTFFDGKNNINIQNETLESLLKGKIDLLMLNLADVSENVIEDIIYKVKQKKTPVIFFNVPPQVVSNVSKNYDKAAFILVDTDQAGMIQGKILVNLWNTNKKALDKNGDNILQYVLLKGETDNPMAIGITKSVISTINDSGIKTQQLALINANWLKEFAKDSMESLFLTYDGKIESIIANNDAMAIGAIEALQKYGYNSGDKSKNIAVVGIDAIPEAKDLIDKGLMTGTVVEDPKILAEAFYNVGMNLLNNLNPIENTNYKVVDGEIVVPFPFQEYIKK
jgi:methyl-galactoside transport system substrate-binding protein